MIRNKALKRYNQFTPVAGIGSRNNDRKGIVATDLKKFNAVDFYFETEAD